MDFPKDLSPEILSLLLYTNLLAAAKFGSDR